MIGVANGKVILLGEHAVVYGCPAIAVGVARGARANVTAVGTGDVAQSTLALGSTTRVNADDSSDLARAFRALLAACGVTSTVTVEAHTDLPAAAGLGCSAALGVAIARALQSAMGRVGADPDRDAQLGAAWESVFHGNASGIDATVAARGGCIYFRRTPEGTVTETVTLAKPLTLAIAHSGQSASTREMVEKVRELRVEFPHRVNNAFQAITVMVPTGRHALELGDLHELGWLMDRNQEQLQKLGVSTPAIEELCIVARHNGALGAKLTGSGGGGCVIALTEPGSVANILADWQERGFSAFATLIESITRPG